jgi:hypothetical protein
MIDSLFQVFSEGFFLRQRFVLSEIRRPSRTQFYFADIAQIVRVEFFPQIFPYLKLLREAIPAFRPERAMEISRRWNRR